MDLERESEFLRTESRRVAHSWQPAFVATIAAFVTAVALIAASIVTPVASENRDFYSSLAQVIPIALLVLAFERRFLGDDVPVGPLARTMTLHGRASSFASSSCCRSLLWR